MILRYYQNETIRAIYEYLRTRTGNPLGVLPTAAGKTPVLAKICSDAVNLWNGKVVVLSHVKELVDQAAEKIKAIDPTLPVGIYSSGLKRRDLGYSITVAGIQSVYNKADKIGAVDLIIIDEAQLIPFDGDGMYRTFIADMRLINPNVRCIGLTATPYRMKGGMICGDDHLFDDICYEIGVKELIKEGFLSKLKTKSGSVKADTSGVHTRAGEFVSKELEAIVDDDQIVSKAVAEVVDLTKDRKAVLWFAAGKKHGEHVKRELLESHGVHAEFVTGDTPGDERDAIAERFKRGQLKHLININIFTVGFDAPIIDAVVLLRPTQSPGLYYQMVGRGFRIHPGKEDCLVLDYGENVIRHGPVDAIKPDEPAKNAGPGAPPAKECPDCHELIAAGFGTCPECGHKFPDPVSTKHDYTASCEGVISGEKTTEVRRLGADPMYTLHTKKDAGPEAPRTLRVEYQIGLNEFVSEWICLEHSGWVLSKAHDWWRMRSNDPIPTHIETAVAMANNNSLAEPEEITIERTSGNRFPKIVDYKLGPKPPANHKWADAVALEVFGVDVTKPPESYADNSYLTELNEDDIPF